jgi:hypothetical protein
LFTLNPTGLTSCRTRGILRLLSSLFALRCGLLLFAFFNGGLTGCSAGLRTHISSFLNHFERCAYDSTLMFDGSAGALLGYFLQV